MYVFNVAEPITLLILLALTVLLIFLGKEVKKPFFPAFGLSIHLVLVLMHSIQLGFIPEQDYDSYFAILIACITIDCVMILMSFFAYLWVDDIASKFYKKKSIDNSLDWFWKQV